MTAWSAADKVRFVGTLCLNNAMRVDCCGSCCNRRVWHVVNGCVHWLVGGCPLESMHACMHALK
jgi:hypothetical protein